MYRRQLLTLGGSVLAGLAGCLSGSPAGDQHSLSATATSLQPVVVRQASADSIGTWSADATQYLHVAVAVDADEAPARRDLRLRFDGTDHEQVDTARGLWRSRDDEGESYDATSGKGWLLFALPATGNQDEPVLTWPGAEVAVTDDVAGSLSTRLAEPAPPLSLEFEVPDVVEHGTSPELSFTVTNEGTLAGRFVAGLDRSGPSVARVPLEAISKPIPPEETVGWSVPDTYDMDDPGPTELGDGEPDVTYYVDSSAGSQTADLRLLAPGRD